VPAEYEWTGGKTVWSTSLRRWRKLAELEKMRDAEVFLDPRIVSE
jgi:signal-transduction protein with cAMP-binding, CBS, and nucleotidyltransferase domain